MIILLGFPLPHSCDQSPISCFLDFIYSSFLIYFLLGDHIFSSFLRKVTWEVNILRRCVAVINYCLSAPLSFFMEVEVDLVNMSPFPAVLGSVNNQVLEKHCKAWQRKGLLLLGPTCSCQQVCRELSGSCPPTSFSTHLQ